MISYRKQQFLQANNVQSIHCLLSASQIKLTRIQDFGRGWGGGARNEHRNFSSGVPECKVRPKITPFSNIFLLKYACSWCWAGKGAGVQHSECCLCLLKSEHLFWWDAENSTGQQPGMFTQKKKNKKNVRMCLLIEPSKGTHKLVCPAVFFNVVLW